MRRLAPADVARSFLAVDVGNSAVKAGLWEGSAWVRTARVKSELAPEVPWEQFLADVLAGERVGAAGVASVWPAVGDAIARAVTNAAAAPTAVHGNMAIPPTLAPFRTEYRTPETLGADRLAGAAAAFVLHGHPAGRAVIALDAGTAITVDAVTADGAHVGGAILPGPDAIVQALAGRTAQLPEVPFERPERAAGVTSVLSIQSGVTSMIIDGLGGLIARTSAEIAPAGAPPLIVATGGWAPWLQAHIAVDVLAPELVLDGVRLLAKG